MPAKLVAEEGNLKGLVLTLEDGNHWVIGRDPDTCQLLIQDPVASRRHLICWDTPEGILLENLSTTNPVQINHEEVKEPRLLHNGDSVKIGSGIFRFYSESEAQLINGAEEEPQVAHEEPHIEDEPSIQEEIEESHIEESPVEEETQHTENEIHNEEPPKEPEEVEEPMPEVLEEIPAVKEEIIEETRQEAPEQQEEPHEEESIHEEPLPQPEEELEQKAPEQKEETLKEEQIPEVPESRHDSIFDEEPTSEEELLAQIDFGILDSGRWLLKVVGGPNNGAEFSMQPGKSYMIGTDPSTCDVIFHDTSVSRQHAKITVTGEDSLTIEDLNSKNGVLLDGEKMGGKGTLPPNTLITLGTTSFVVFDREGEMKTIISPFLPAIVQALKKDEKDKEDIAEIRANAIEEKATQEAALAAARAEQQQPMAAERKEKNRAALTAYILIAILIGSFVLVGIGVTTLFHGDEVVVEEVVNQDQMIADALAPFKGVKYQYNKATGTLLMVGHVLSENDKKQLRFNLQGLKFVKNIDDTNIIIDERYWQEINPSLSKNPKWKGVTLQASSPGNFVLTGYLKNRDEMDSLLEYMSANFPFMDQLENKVLVEEDVMGQINTSLRDHGFMNVRAGLNNGELILRGGIPQDKDQEYTALIEEMKAIPGIRNVQNFVTEIESQKSMVDVTDRYEVSGISQRGKNLMVMIDGRIVMKGDQLDNMTITDIMPEAVYLEKDGVKYKINLR
jgi:type III secretion system YscD/HrpQ family protein